MTSVWPYGDPRDVARAIVAQPRFRGSTAPDVPGATLLDRFFGWIGERFNAIFHVVGRVLGHVNAFNGVLMASVVVVLCAGAIALFVAFLRLPSRTYRAGGRRVLAPIERGRTSADFLAVARRCVAAEEWSAASSALLGAALLTLDETGRLRYDPARTVGEARRAIRDPAFDAFEREATAALFDAGAADADRIERMRAAYANAFGVSA